MTITAEAAGVTPLAMIDLRIRQLSQMQVAREYGVPAVLGAGVATACIVSGQLSEVDGNPGTIKILPTVQPA